jgi:Integrase zinc binding domain/RNase H-like domain found in reverse transcriptase
VREKELAAIIHALKTWRPYLLDQPFTVETDHKSLQELLSQRKCTQRLARWLNLLSEYKPEFKWIPGNTNDTADGLSRRADFQSEERASTVDLRDLLRSILDQSEEELNDIEESEKSAIHFMNLDHAMMVYYLMREDCDIRALCLASYESDEHFSDPWKYFSDGGQNEDAEAAGFKYFQFEKGLLWYSKYDGQDLRLCIPKNDDLRRQVIFSEHDSLSRGHPGIYKTSKFIESKYYWPNMRKSITNYVNSCEKCQRNKHRQTKSPGKLNPLPIPECRWQEISMDFMLGLPLSDGNNAIWVIVDRLTKRAHFIPLFMGAKESSAINCAKLFYREYQRLHGIPVSIISDRDTRFSSDFWVELMKLQGSNHTMSSAFKPSTDGQSERTNRFIEDYLRNYVHVGRDCLQFQTS